MDSSKRVRDVSAIGIVFSTGVLMITELLSYMMIFFEQSTSTESVSRYLSEATLKKRHKTNAITLTGQFLTWLAGGWYIIMALVLSLTAKTEQARELGALLKIMQFGIIPAIEIVTSPAIRRYVLSFLK